MSFSDKEILDKLRKFATRCIEAGILPKIVQRYLGHATLQLTMDLYVHVTEEFKQKELEKLNDVFTDEAI